MLGGAESPKEVAFQDSVVALVALPGYFVAVALIGRMGPRRMQVTCLFFFLVLLCFRGWVAMKLEVTTLLETYVPGVNFTQLPRQQAPTIGFGLSIVSGRTL